MGNVEWDETRRSKVLAKIARGETVSTRDEMPVDLIDLHVLTIEIQERCERWGGIHYLACAAIAPNQTERDFIIHTGYEELGHARILRKGPLAVLGVTDLTPAPSAKLEKNILTIFQYPEKLLEGWAWVRMFNFLQDRAAGIQLARFKKGPFQPWNAAIAQIEAEEEGHVASGEEAIKKMASYGERMREELQKALAFWLPLALNGFGGPDATSRRLPLYRLYNLKDSNDGERRVFIAQIKPILETCGLSHALLVSS